MKLGKYQHYKGMYYFVIGVGRHSESLEEMVIYLALYDNPKSNVWIRPKKMFLEKVMVDGKKVPRFKYIGK